MSQTMLLLVLVSNWNYTFFAYDFGTPAIDLRFYFAAMLLF